ATLDAAVERAEQNLDGVRARPNLVEQRLQRRAAPFRGAHRLGEPGLTDRTRLQQGAAVAGAFECDGLGDTRPFTEGIEGERGRPFHGTGYLQVVSLRVNRRDVVVDEQVVEPGRRDVVPQRFERERMVTRREPQLVLADALSLDRAGRRDVHRPTLALEHPGVPGQPSGAGRQRTTGRFAAPASSSRRTGVVCGAVRATWGSSFASSRIARTTSAKWSRRSFVSVSVGSIIRASSTSRGKYTVGGCTSDRKS